MNNDHTNAEVILAVPLDQPERLFAGDGSDLKQEWRELAALWHPDRNPHETRANEVLQHINVLYDAAQQKLATGQWEGSGVLMLDDRNGARRELRYRRMSRFELGECYIGDAFVAFALEKASRDLFDAAVQTIGGFRYADDAMRRAVARGLPRLEATAETAERLVLVVRRKTDMVMLGDLIRHFGGRLDPRHAAWIVSGLSSLACYLEWAGIMHGAIAPDTVFVSPKHHTVAVLGGWWYATRTGERLRALPQRTLNSVPPIVMDIKRATCAVDQELIRQLAREMLGDPGGTKLLRDKSVPTAFARWIAHPPARSAYADYCNWEKAREASFGARKFIELPVHPGDIYR
ncbi:MAG: molecular chaperone DnaJ [Alphaproteobacteria bacterium]